MKSSSKILQEIISILNKEGICSGDLEFTENNYTSEGKLISERIPTYITELGEIGIYRNELYLVIIIPKLLLNNSLYSDLIKLDNIEVYGFINFKKNLFPKKNQTFLGMVKDLKKEEYFQIQLNFHSNTKASSIIQGILNIKELLNKHEVNYIDQLHNPLC